VNALTAISIGSAAFLVGLGGVLWVQYGSATFAAMIESGYLLYCH
jgi:hypothetical protein